MPRLRHGAAGHVFILIDDADLTSAGALAPLVEFLPASRDIGLHLVIARPAAGAARALYEPFLAAVRHSDAMGLQMSAAADEDRCSARRVPRRCPGARGAEHPRRRRAAGQVAWSAP